MAEAIKMVRREAKEVAKEVAKTTATQIAAKEI